MAAAWDGLRKAVEADAEENGGRLTGFHNHNYVLRTAAKHVELLRVGPGTPVKLRVRAGELTVVERPWPSESALLAALDRTALRSSTPRCYGGADGIAAHEFVPGTVLADVCPSGKPLEQLQLEALVGLMAAFLQVPADRLPELPAGWAPDGDTRAFLRARADFAEQGVRRSNWAEFGSLFAALEVPANALRTFRDRIPAMQSRPFGLIHADLHRHNVIVRPDGELTVVDWELAMWGDPLHDLAIHLVRMHYPRDQRWEVVERWRKAADKVRPGAAAGLERDLPVYISYERAQSLYADTLRAAAGLGRSLDTALVGAAVSRVRNALHLAAGPLQLTRVPTRTQVERALVDWVRKRRAAAQG